MRRTLPSLLAVLMVALPAHAQVLARRDDTLVERVVAVVGDSAITLTQLSEHVQLTVLQMRAQGRPAPEDPAAVAALEERALQELINQQLILQAAARDSTLIPDDEEIEANVTQALQQTVERLGGDASFRAALAADGVTQAEYREQIKQRIRSEQIQQMFMVARLRNAPPVAVTEADMRASFDSVVGSLGQRPELITLRQVVVTPGASDSAWAIARTRIDTILSQVRAGADFAELARQHSMDGSAAAGGDLGWFRRGQMVREFEEVAFRLADGEVSEPVRTPFGWHLVKVDRSRPGEVKARHILIRPDAGPDAAERARAMADEIARRATAGEPMGALVEEFRAHHDAEIPDSVTIPRAQLAQALPAPYQQPLAGVTEGAVVGPFAFPIRDQTAWVVVKVTEVRPAGAYTFEDLRSRIETQLREQRQIERLLRELRERTHVDVRM